MYTWPHSVHSVSATISFCSIDVEIFSTSRGELSWISHSAAIAFATTAEFSSEIMSCRDSMKPCSSTSVGLTSYSLQIHMAAVLRT